MNYYIDITLLPSDDIGIHFLWSKVMMQVHLALVEIQDEQQKVPVAVSFPQYRGKTENKPGFVGHQLRLLATDKSDLERLAINKWLNRLADYVHIKGINQVPSTDTYESFTRYNSASSVEKLVRRRMKRHNETLEQASEYFNGYKIATEDKAMPFIRMKSLTSHNDFCLCIARKQAKPAGSSIQKFNTYGLSANGILPKF
jgi:CRISPR-associated endonuclease Csy4